MLPGPVNITAHGRDLGWYGVYKCLCPTASNTSLGLMLNIDTHPYPAEPKLALSMDTMCLQEHESVGGPPCRATGSISFGRPE